MGLGFRGVGFRVISWLYRDDGKEHGNCSTIIGYIGGIWG